MPVGGAVSVAVRALVVVTRVVVAVGVVAGAGAIGAAELAAGVERDTRAGGGGGGGGDSVSTSCSFTVGTPCSARSAASRFARTFAISLRIC